MENTKAPAWYIPGPFHRYTENVKTIARTHGLRVVDSRFVDPEVVKAEHKKLEKVPSAKLKPEFMPKKDEK